MSDLRMIRIIAKTQEELQDLVKRSVDTGSKYNMEIDINKSQVMRISRNNGSLRIKVCNREQKGIWNMGYEDDKCHGQRRI